MKDRRISVEQGVFVLAFLIALFFRSVYLNKITLGDIEANWAFQAYSVSKGLPIGDNSQNLYVVLTSFLFFIFGSTDFMARIIPAVMGSLIVFVPFLLRGKIGKWAAVFCAYGLALDPGLVAISRQAGSPIFSITLLLMSAGFMNGRKMSLAGFTFGLFLLSGQSIWFGILSLAIASGWHWGIHHDKREIIRGKLAITSKYEWGKWVGWTIGAYCCFGTLFFTLPLGLSAIASSLNDFLVSVTTGGAPLILIFISLLTYELFPLIFGIIGIVRPISRKSEFDTFLSMWFIVALGLSIINPGRNIGDFVWAILPLWVITARLMESWLIGNIFESKSILFLQGSITFVLLLFVWLNMTGLTNPGTGGGDLQSLRILSCVVAMVIIILMGALIWVGWTYRQAAAGLLSGVSLFLILFFLSGTWNGAGSGRNPGSEVWRVDPYPAEMGLLIKTMGDMSEWKYGNRDFREIMIVGIDSPSLQWALRKNRNVEYLQDAPADTTAAYIIARPGYTLATPVSYRGQDFVGWEMPTWKLLFAEEWVKWATIRKIPVSKDPVILWVRSDMFPGAEPAQN